MKKNRVVLLCLIHGFEILLQMDELEKAGTVYQKLYGSKFVLVDIARPEQSEPIKISFFRTFSSRKLIIRILTITYADPLSA